MDTAFNSTDDDVFIALRNYTLSVLNPLWDCFPSTLNLSSNCLSTTTIATTLNLTSDHPTVFMELWSLQVLGPGVQAALPSSHRALNITLAEKAAYLTTLRVQPLGRRFGQIIYNVISQCVKTNRLFFAPGDVDFTKNCTATVAYWEKYIAIPGAESARIDRDESAWDDVNLFRDSLAPHLGMLDPLTIMAAANPTRTGGNFTKVVDQAAKSCALQKCRSLNYPGNGDMAGDGVVIAFTSIAIVTSVACIVAFLFRYLASLRPRSWMKAAVHASESFRTTLFFFAIMTGIASWAQITRSTSYYERMLNALNAFVSSNACVALLYLVHHDEKKDEDRPSGIIKYSLPVAGMLLWAFTGRALNELAKQDTAYVLDRYSDFGCYISTNSPLDWTFELACAQMTFLTCSFIACTLAALIEKRRHHSGSRRDEQTVSRILRSSTFNVLLLIMSTLAITLMWMEIAAIFRIRKRAKSDFGDSYGDNNLGYGQIVAMFFCLEALALFVYILCYETYDKRIRKRGVYQHFTTSDPLLKDLDIALTQLDTPSGSPGADPLTRRGTV